MFRHPSSSTRSILCSMEKTQSLISPYTCYGLRALCYGWSAAVLWSRLFLLHVHGLRARRYGLWASQGQELSKKNQLLRRHLYYIYLQVISPTTEQHMFRPILYGEDSVSNPSLHVLWAPRSALWVVGYGSLVTPIPPTHARAPCSTLWTMG